MAKKTYGTRFGVDFDEASVDEIAATITAERTDADMAVIAAAMDSAEGRARAKKARETMAKQQMRAALALRDAAIAAAKQTQTQTRKR